MPYTVRGRVNRGAYESPFSGVGVEFYPVGVKPGRSEIILHESGYLPANSAWNFPSVFSPFWRLYYNSAPGHCVLYNDNIFELTPDKIMLIPDRRYFHCLGENPVSNLWMAFSFSEILLGEVPIPVLLPIRNTEQCLITDLMALISAAENWEPTDAIYRTSLALLQVVLARSELRWCPPIPEALAVVKTYIEDNINGNLNNEVLARKAGMSAGCFGRVFKHYYDCTPARYVLEMRIREASQLLLQSEESLDAIAEATGFPNRAYFSRVFKKIVKVPPAAFRRNARG